MKIKKAVLTSSQYVRISRCGQRQDRVLTMRIAHLIEQCHVWPNKILAITLPTRQPMK
ncbi:MAG: hypothetical protein ACLSA6_06815 [Holdemania massiliensis]